MKIPANLVVVEANLSNPVVGSTTLADLSNAPTNGDSTNSFAFIELIAEVEEWMGEQFGGVFEVDRVHLGFNFQKEFDVLCLEGNAVVEETSRYFRVAFRTKEYIEAKQTENVQNT